MVTGDQTGDVCIFDLKSDEALASTPKEPMQPSKAFRAHGDSVNGVRYVIQQSSAGPLFSACCRVLPRAAACCRVLPLALQAKL